MVQLLRFSIFCYSTVSMLVMVLSYGFPDGMRVALLELAMLAVFVVLLLYLLGKPARIRQTLSALTGAGTLLGLPALLLVIAAPEQEASPLSMAWLMLLVWNLLVTAHIMRHALSSSLAIGLAVALLYILVSTQVIVTAFPQLAGQ